MKHLVKPECRHGCRFIQITPALWLCPHASYGEASYLKGAVDEARTLLERSGGYDAVVRRIEGVEEARRKAREEAREKRASSARLTVRYDKRPKLI